MEYQVKLIKQLIYDMHTGLKFLFILSIILGVQTLSSASKSVDEKMILKRKIDSCYNQQQNLNPTQLDEMISLSLMLNEYTELENLLQAKGLYAEKYHVKMNHFLEHNNLDSAYFYFKDAKNLYLTNNKVDKSVLLTRLEKQFVSWCLVNNYISIVSSELNKFVKDIYADDDNLDNYWLYLVLMQAYGTQSKLDQFFDLGTKLLSLQSKNLLLFLFKAVVCTDMMSYSLITENPKAALAYCDSSQVFMAKVPKSLFETSELSLQYKLWQIDLYGYQSASYSFLGEFEQAEKALKKMQEILDDSSSNYKIGALNLLQDVRSFENWVHLVYFYQKENYPKAYSYLLENKKIGIPRNLYPDYKNIYKWDAKILAKMNRSEEAIDALDKLMSYKDSLYELNSTKEINSIWALYEVEKAQQQKMQSDLRTDKLFTISVSIGLIVLLAVVVIIYFIINTKRLRSKNKILFAQQKELLSKVHVKPLEDLETSNMDVKDQELSDVNLHSGSNSLYVSILRYLRESKEFTNFNVSREFVAKQLGTNRQYIIDAIAENTKMTFNEFINNLRIDFARELLMDKKENILIKNVYSEAGFKNRNTFSRLFKEKYGMSPSEFRDCVKNDF